MTEQEYWQVSFASFHPKRAKVGGHEVFQLTEKSRRPIITEEITHLLGAGWDAEPLISTPESK